MHNTGKVHWDGRALDGMMAWRMGGVGRTDGNAWLASVELSSLDRMAKDKILA